MKKQGKLWICAAVMLLSVGAVSLFPPRAENAGNEVDTENTGMLQEAAPPPDFDYDAELAERIFGKTLQTTKEEEARIRSDLQAVGKLCGPYYLSAEKLPSAHEYDAQENIPQADIDNMEEALIRAGYCVVNSDAVYPEYLENHEALFRFWDEVVQGRNAETAIWSISSSGSVYCRIFQFADGSSDCIHASGSWDDTGALCLRYLHKSEILYWDMTASGLIYQCSQLDRHWNAANLLRLQSVDHTLYDLTEKYISPIGYHNVNLFLLDWDSSDLGNLCLNDLLSGMYWMEYGEHLYARDYPYADEPFSHSVIPAELFESVIYAHFNIPLEEFRERALYDAENDAYPWQDLYCGNVLYYPELIPEVTKVTDNADGTVTLLVNVICPDKHTDHLFEHEVTMNIEPDGSFQYLSNRIGYRGRTELPSPQARIEVQRFDV